MRRFVRNGDHILHILHGPSAYLSVSFALTIHVSRTAQTKRPRIGRLDGLESFHSSATGIQWAPLRHTTAHVGRASGQRASRPGGMRQLRHTDEARKREVSSAQVFAAMGRVNSHPALAQREETGQSWGLAESKRTRLDGFQSRRPSWHLDCWNRGCGPYGWLEDT